MVMHLTYLVISLAIVSLIIRTLFVNGRPFLVLTFDGDERLADAVNGLLVVGCYLTKAAYAVLFVRLGDGRLVATDLALHAVSAKLGLLLILIGCLHMAVMVSLTAWRLVVSK